MLELSGCSSLRHFPEISETMEHLKYLYLDGTAVEELPLSTENLKNLCWLRLENCRNLIYLPESLRNSTSLYGINISGCPKLKKTAFKVSDCQYPDRGYMLTSLPELSKLDLALEETKYILIRPVSDESRLISLTSLDLSGNIFEMLPASIKQLFALRDLDISFCDRLRSLSYLPQSLIYLNANECRSLETASGIKHLLSEYICRCILKKKKKTQLQEENSSSQTASNWIRHHGMSTRHVWTGQLNSHLQLCLVRAFACSKFIVPGLSLIL
ncbi:disease resistance-like protein DSC1 [Mercurialis annua]|uniref:disease resistance-like protein DSC1 n=1 Tax=Mercurialis annua TaxID=3986 RepID=UPI00215E8AAE|nr:disease resistance-like protein DSC1 [Mercurialis annua]